VTARVYACRYPDEVVHGRELFTLLVQCSLLRMREYCVNALALLARYKGFEGMCASKRWNNLDVILTHEECILLASELIFLKPERSSCLDV